MATRDEVKALLKDGYGLTVTSETPIQAGTQISTAEGPKVNVFDSGACVPNGKKLHLIPDFKERLASGEASSGAVTPRSVFVVYGHDSGARLEPVRTSSWSSA